MAQLQPISSRLSGRLGHQRQPMFFSTAMAAPSTNIQPRSPTPSALLLATLASALRSHERLLVENLLLRQQLQVALRCQRRPRLRTRDKLFWLVVRPLHRELATPPPLGPPRDRAGLAPPGLAPRLALAVRPLAGTTALEPRGPEGGRRSGTKR